MIITGNTRGSISTPGEMMCPTTMMMVQLINALMTPDRVFPNITDEMWTGHRRSSSKLM